MIPTFFFFLSILKDSNQIKCYYNGGYKTLLMGKGDKGKDVLLECISLSLFFFFLSLLNYLFIYICRSYKISGSNWSTFKIFNFYDSKWKGYFFFFFFLLLKLLYIKLISRISSSKWRISFQKEGGWSKYLYWAQRK